MAARSAWPLTTTVSGCPSCDNTTENPESCPHTSPGGYIGAVTFLLILFIVVGAVLAYRFRFYRWLITKLTSKSPSTVQQNPGEDRANKSEEKLSDYEEVYHSKGHSRKRDVIQNTSGIINDVITGMATGQGHASTRQTYIKSRINRNPRADARDHIELSYAGEKREQSNINVYQMLRTGHDAVHDNEDDSIYCNV